MIRAMEVDCRQRMELRVQTDVAGTATFVEMCGFSIREILDEKDSVAPTRSGYRGVNGFAIVGGGGGDGGSCRFPNIIHSNSQFMSLERATKIHSYVRPGLVY